MKWDLEGLKKVFSSAICIHAIVALIVLILSETVGLWFLNSYMNIPNDRMIAANWVYQFSVATFIVNIMSVPYNASIIAHEKMSAFAYISIIEAVLRLLIVFLIQVILYDRLIMYGFLMLLIGITIRIIYGRYCSRNFTECHFYKTMVDKSTAKQMFSFSSWIIVGGLISVLHTQGIAICVNMFFGPVVNAALGISNIVNMKVNSFTANFQMAMNPQLVKNYAAGKLEEMHKLIFRGCRFSFYLIIIFAIPLIIEAPAIIGFWLEDVPEYTVAFVRLALLASVANSYSGVLSTSQGATGKIQVYQVTLTTIGALHVPFTIWFFYLGYPPYFCSWVYVFVMSLEQVCRICFVCRSTKMSGRLFLTKVISRSLLVMSLCSIIPIILHVLWDGGIVVLAIKCVISFIYTGIIAFTLGLESNEKELILETINNKVLHKIKH